jgi:CRP-like cAMP-binding protein
VAARYKNRLLASMSPEELALLRPEMIQLHVGDVLGTADTPLPHFVFLERGLVSATKQMSDGQEVDVGFAGMDGLVGASALHHPDRLAFGYAVQISGTGYRVPRHTMLFAWPRIRPVTREMLDRFHYAALAVNSQLVACNATHAAEPRCCRWLASARDSVRSSTFELSQKYIAGMLGVTTTTVSQVFSRLREDRVLRAPRRGLIEILDSSALLDRACECYPMVKAMVDSVFVG